jgi:hypothetical protein
MSALKGTECRRTRYCFYLPVATLEMARAAAVETGVSLSCIANEGIAAAARQRTNDYRAAQKSREVKQ